MSRREMLKIDLDIPKPLGILVYEALRDAIISRVLKPGERLMETELAEEMGVSRTPVREAMRKLELESYIVMIPRKGAYVAGLSIRDITNLFEIRGALESLAAGLAASRATKEEIEEMERSLAMEANHFKSGDVLKTIEVDTKFHELIYKASQNIRLQNLIIDLCDQIQRYRTTSLAVPGRMKFALTEHRRIVEAIADGNVYEAQTATKEHIESAENVLLEVISKQKDK